MVRGEDEEQAGTNCSGAVTAYVVVDEGRPVAVDDCSELVCQAALCSKSTDRLEALQHIAKLLVHRAASDCIQALQLVAVAGKALGAMDGEWCKVAAAAAAVRTWW